MTWIDSYGQSYEGSSMPWVEVAGGAAQQYDTGIYTLDRAGVMRLVACVTSQDQGKLDGTGVVTMEKDIVRECNARLIVDAPVMLLTLAGLASCIHEFAGDPAKMTQTMLRGCRTIESILARHLRQPETLTPKAPVAESGNASATESGPQPKAE